MARAQEQDDQPKKPSPPIAAVVNGDPVYVASLESKYATIAKQRGFNSKQSLRAKAELLTQLVNQNLVVQALERDGKLVKAEEIEQQLDQLSTQVRKEQGMTLEGYAEQHHLTVDAIRNELFWKLAWQRYLERHLADALEEYFNEHKKDLDGTEVRASHILLRPENYNETDEQIAARANKIRKEIESGQITFEQAAAKYSAGPSRAKGGDLGFIPRYGVMVADFSSAAFELEEGEISEPVVTPFGTHLIRVTAIKPGRRQWTEVIPQIKALASADLFEELAKREARNAKIEYTGTVPYIEPDTNELVVPTATQPVSTK